VCSVDNGSWWVLQRSLPPWAQTGWPMSPHVPRVWEIEVLSLEPSLNSIALSYRVCSWVQYNGCGYRREELGQLSVIEVDPTHTSTSHTHPKRISSPGLAVKEYVRAGAGHHVPSPHDLRPPGTLVQTMDYLMNRWLSHTISQRSVAIVETKISWKLVENCGLLVPFLPTKLAQTWKLQNSRNISSVKVSCYRVLTSTDTVPWTCSWP
jgi:hypothetical protein